jgi:hypothetical protein
VTPDTTVLPIPPAPLHVCDLETLRLRAEMLALGLRRHNEQETDLVQESVTTDLGAGD